MLDFQTHAKQRPDTRIFAFGLGKTQNSLLHAVADFKALLGADYEVTPGCSRLPLLVFLWGGFRYSSIVFICLFFVFFVKEKTNKKYRRRWAHCRDKELSIAISRSKESLMK